MADRRRGRFPQTDTYHAVRRRTQKRRFPWQWLAIALAGVVLGLAITTPLWLVQAIRAFVPDRYVAAYFPESIQELVFETNPLQHLPTAQPVDLGMVSTLYQEIAPATPLPTIDGSGDEAEADPPAGGGPEPTPTSPFVSAGGSSSQAEPASYSNVTLSGFEHVYQGWNNCGPATLTTYLSYWELPVTQQQAAAFIKPNPEDRNVRPDELQAFTRSVGMEMTVRINGSLNLLKRLIAAGYPVMIEKGFDPEPDRLGWMGHYLLIIGYSDDTQTFVTMDSYLGPNRIESYAHIERFWRHFNRTYLVAYPRSEADRVAAIIGENMDDTVMYRNALATARAETQLDPNDPFAWFNLGSVLVEMGDHENAALAFDLARERGTPWRMLWYQFGPYEAYLGVGGNRLYDVITLADAVIANNPYSEEAYYYKGLAYAAQGETSAAVNQFNKAIRYNENYHAAREALVRVSEG